MKVLNILLFIGLVVAGNSEAVKPSHSLSATQTNDKVVVVNETSKNQALEFLLSASAKDFMTHMPPEPLEFRAVKLGEIANSDGSIMFILCGEFLVEETKDVFNWIDFSTIKTDGHEQWLGAQAKGLCQQVEIVWDEEDDLSGLLLERLSSYR